MSFDLSGGLYAITDRKLIPEECLARTVEAAIRGGAKVIQLREKGADKSEVVRRGKAVLRITREYGVPLIINDSPEAAKETGADGVHLGGDDAPVEEARNLLGGGAIIGVSCYGDIERGVEAEKQGANYAAFGTPYFTPTKPDRDPTPFEVLREAKRRLKIPVFAIGGITPENVSDVLETGVDGVAVITAIFGVEDTEEAVKEIAGFFEDEV